MSNLLCLTCLSSLEDGTSLTDALTNFLCKVLHFKKKFLKSASNAICRKCYKTLIEIKCFYTQLRDVEVYFESKHKVSSNPIELIQEVEEPCIPQLECTSPMTDYASKQDPIFIEKIADTSLLSADNNVPPPKQNQSSSKKRTASSIPPKPTNSVKKLVNILPKQNNTASKVSEKRFVCLMCSMLFSSVDDLRSHEQTHYQTTNLSSSTIFLPAVTQTPTEPNIGANGKSLNKTKLIERKRKYEVSECNICSKKYLNMMSLAAHMKLMHNKLMDEDGANVKENVELPLRNEEQSIDS